MLDFTVATVTACYQQRRRMYACVPIFPLTSCGSRDQNTEITVITSV